MKVTKQLLNKDNKIRNDVKSCMPNDSIYKLNINKTNLKLTYKKSNEIKYKKIKIKKKQVKAKILLYLWIYIFLTLFFEILTKKTNITKKRELNEDFNEISIVIKEIGTQGILNRMFKIMPNKICINDEWYNTTNKYQVYNLTNETNKIIMKWNNKLDTCENMFSGLINVTEIDFSNFDTSRVTSMEGMFYNCKNLISIININHFNTKSVTQMLNMFFSCENLISLDLSSFDTSLVTSMKTMFYCCYKLIILDISNFNTTSTKDMNFMFGKCNSLISLDTSKFDTSLVTDMAHMFYECKSLISLNVSSFNTSLVENMKFMFHGLESLGSLDLLNFDTSKVTNMEGMFDVCQNLKYLNLSSFNTSKVSNLKSMFYNCFNLINIDLSSFDTSSVLDMETMFINCNSLTSLDLSNFNTESVINMKNMFRHCNKLNYINLYSFTENNNLTLENIFYKTKDIKFYCIYNESKTPRIISELNPKNFVNNCSHFCFNKNFKYITDKTICIDECINDDIYQFHYENMCYSKCPNGTNNSLKNYYECEIITYQNSNYNNNILNCSSENFFKRICSIDNNNSEMIDEMVKNIKEDIKNKNIDSLLSNILYGDKNDLLIIDNLAIYQITSTENQNNNEYNYTSIIKLGECENILKKQYTVYFL